MDGNANYYIRARHKGLRTRESAWSNAASFTTGDASGLPSLFSHQITGYDNYPSNANIYFGSSVAVNQDAGILAVGSINADILNAVDNYGNVCIYKFNRSSSTWEQNQVITPHSVETNGSHGLAIALSGDGNYLLIADKWPSGSLRGRVEVHSLNQATGNYDYQQTLYASDGVASDLFGSSIALNFDGTIALIGSMQDDTGALNNNGSVYYFTRSGASWVEVSKFVATTGDQEDGMFGSSIAIDHGGEIALIGSKNGTTPLGANSGRTYYYKRSGNVWTEIQSFYPSDVSADDWFGAAVAVSGDGNIAAISSSQDDDGGVNTGSIYFYVRVDDLWIKQSKFSDSSLTAYSDFIFTLPQHNNIYNPGPGIEAGVLNGSALALSSNGKKLFVGQPKRGADDRGEVFVFTDEVTLPKKIVNTVNYLGSSSDKLSDICLTPSLKSLFIASDEGGYLKFYSTGGELTENLMTYFKTYSGNFFSIVMSNALQYPRGLGDVILTGERVSPGSSIGKVNYLVPTGSLDADPDPLEHKYSFQAPNPELGDYFGFDCAISGAGDYAAVGAPGSLAGAGKVHVFSISVSGSTHVQEIITPVSDMGAEEFGCSVAMSEDRGILVIGARRSIRDPLFPEIRQGCVYIYKFFGNTYVYDRRIFYPYGNIDGDLFGHKCRLNKTGTTLVVSSPYMDGTDSFGGGVSFYSRAGDAWSFVQEKAGLKNSGPSLWFGGEAIALSPSGGLCLISGYGIEPGNFAVVN